MTCRDNSHLDSPFLQSVPDLPGGHSQ